MADEQRAAAYVPFGTFKNQLDRFAEGGVPSRVDRSAFGGLAGGTQTQLLAAMKFLGLVDEQGEPQPVLNQLVKRDELARKPLLKQILERSYPKVFELDLKAATPQQLNEALGEYNVSGSTLKKAVRFFQLAASEVGIELSPYLQKAQSSAGNGTPRRRRSRGAKKPETTTSPAAVVAGSGNAKVLQLASGGGSVTLAYSVDLFSLTPTDRNFVIELITKLEEYEAAHPAKKAKTPRSEPAAEEDTEEQEEGDQE